MQINYLIIALVLLAVILLLIFFIRRNWKEQKKFERQMNQPGVKPEKHEEDQ